MFFIGSLQGSLNELLKLQIHFLENVCKAKIKPALQNLLVINRKIYGT